MDFLRLARNGIEEPEKVAELPCDMGFTGNDDGMDHPFLFAQAGAEGSDENDEPTREPVDGLSEPTKYEMAGEWDLYKNDPRLGYYPHGEGWEEELFNAGTENEQPARAEYTDVNTGKVIHDLCKIVFGSIRLHAESVKHIGHRGNPIGLLYPETPCSREDRVALSCSCDNGKHRIQVWRT